MRVAVLVALLCVVVALFAASAVEAGKKCARPDCSDVIGEGLVRDNLGHAHHFANAHEHRMHESQRIQRVQMKKRGELP